MLLNGSLRPLLGRSCLIPELLSAFQCFRCIRLLRKKYPPRQKHIMEDRQMFGKLVVPAKMRDRVSVNIKFQPDTELLYVKRATLDPWRRLVRRNGYLQPELPYKFVRFSSTFVSAPRISNSEEVRNNGSRCIAKEFIKNGVDMHSYLKPILCSEASQTLGKNMLILNNLRNQFKHIKDEKANKIHMMHPTLYYKGYVDTVVLFKDTMSVIKWSKSDGAFLIAAYIRAINRFENYPFVRRRVKILVAFSTGEIAFVLELNEHK